LADKAQGVARKINVETRKSNEFVEVIVSDNGAGILREFRERIFDPFFSTKPAGSGLGLAQVHKIVREHDGRIDVESEEGKGTKLKIRIPV
jgi:signal transduction histidine kinase